MSSVSLQQPLACKLLHSNSVTKPSKSTTELESSNKLLVNQIAVRRDNKPTYHHHQPTATCAVQSTEADMHDNGSEASTLCYNSSTGSSSGRNTMRRRRLPPPAANHPHRLKALTMMLTLTLVIHCTATLALLASSLQVLNQSSPLDDSNRLIATSISSSSSSNSGNLSLINLNNTPTAPESMVGAASENHENGYGEFNGNFDESQEGADLNFSLMNAPHDKLQAVKHLINTQRSLLSQQQQQQQSPSQHDQSTGNSLQCTHKGRQYLNGQTVPIEDQPCLNCTCRRAILQCYLRVCPPVISLEAHKRAAASAAAGSGSNPAAAHRCHMVKEAHQCCPTTRCEPAYELSGASTGSAESSAEGSSPSSTSTSSSSSSSSPPSSSSSSSSSSSASSQVSGDANTVSLNSAEDNQNARVVTIRGNSDSELVVRFESASNRSVNEPSPMATNVLINTTPLSLLPGEMQRQQQQQQSIENSNLPKLTVIKGPAGQRDSILLITSNPNAVNGALHAREKMHLDNGTSSGTLMTSSGLSNNNNNHHHSALLDSLLETVYSSVAQLNGLNLQGSCMINGSLYVEGSAVIPKGNAYCQYCYCIRQKIMCIKPKCHLMISGCTAKYSNEYACCPTSYSCSNNDLALTPLLSSSKASSSAYGSTGAARLSLEPHSLSARLSAAIESLSRLSSPVGSGADSTGSTSASAASVSPRQIDGARDSDHSLLPSAMLALLSSVTRPASNRTYLQTSNYTSAAPVSTATPTTSTTTSTTSTTTTTTTSTSTTTSTTTTTPPPTTTARASGGSASADKSSSAEAEDDAEDEEEETESDVAKKADKKVNSTSSSTTERVADQTPSSVSDFLEPMNKLGPLVVSPTTPSSCTENGRQYAIGEQIPTLESCKHCYCGLDGIKECKMIECSLKIAHNCKPITPEGHCCPVRYDCPSQAGPHNGLHNGAHLQRYRSETGGRRQPPSLAINTATAAPISQCKSELGLDDCSQQQAANQTAFDDSTGNGNGAGALENIRGLTVDNEPFPILKSTRIVDDSPATVDTSTNRPFLPSGNSSAHLLVTPAAAAVNDGDTNLSSAFESARAKNNSAASQQQLNNLSEELSKFIMQISQNSTQGTGYTLVPTGAGAPDQSAAAAVALNGGGSGQRLNDTTTQEMMINDQHSRMVDYHSVQAPRLAATESPENEPQSEPLRGDSPLKEGRGEITGSGQITPVAEPEVAGRAILSSVEYATHPDERSQVHTGGQRDSRSNDELRLLNQLAPNAFSNQHYYQSNGAEPANITSQVTRENRTDFDDYIDDTNNAKQARTNAHLTSARLNGLNTSGLPHIRLMRNNHQPPNSASLVVFDDNLNNSSNNANFGNEPVTTTINTNSLNDLFNARSNFTTSTENPTTNLPKLEEVATTRLPPQPTTGTPIGLDAERNSETRGWLRSLSGIVQSFGRRLSGTSPNSPELTRGGNELDGAASVGSLDKENRQGELASPTAFEPRSKQQSVFNQLLEMINGPELQLQQQQQQPQPKELVMRPLTGVVRFENDAQVQDQAKQFGRTRPPYEPNASTSSSEIEIVTAEVPVDREIFETPVTTASKSFETEQTATNNSPPRVPLSTNGNTSFSRRSDVINEEEQADQARGVVAATVAAATTISTTSRPASDRTTGYFTLSTSALDSNGNALYRVDKQISEPTGRARGSSSPKTQLNCYDAANNKTYLANEIIPKNDPCKTCTCILGEELCQTLVCPEKPAEDCKEERQPGQCCANYLCSNNVTKLDKLPSQDWNARADTSEDKALNSKLLAKPNPPGTMIATQRALQVNSDPIISNSNHVDQRPPPRMVVSSASSLAHQLPTSSPQATVINNHVRGGSLFDGRARQMASQQLPQQPIRISDLQNLLPPHLRFRPNLQNNLYVPNQQQSNTMLFNNQQQQQQQNNRRSFNQDSISQLINTGGSQQVRRNDFLQVNNRIPLNLLQSQFNNHRMGGTNSFINPSVLSHPPRVSGGSLSSPSQSSVAVLDLPARRNLMEDQPKPSEQNIWRQPAPPQQSNVGAILPPNILTSRMSGPQTPVQLISENRSSAGNGSTWLGQPTPPHHLLNPIPIAVSQQQEQSSTNSRPPLAMRPLDLSSMMISSSPERLRPPVPEVTSVQPQRDRVLFQDQPSSQFSLNSNSVDTGFRPIVISSQRTITESSPVTTTSSSDFSTTNLGPSATGEPPASVQPTTQMNLPSQQMQPQRQADTFEPTRVDNFIVTRVPEEVVSSSTGRPIDETSSFSITTEPSLKSSSSTTDAFERQQSTVGEPSSSVTSGEITSTSSKTPDSESTGMLNTEPSVEQPANDPLGMFRVSECNIYGRIYKVGTTIHELNENCKKCTCTSNGVECQNIC